MRNFEYYTPTRIIFGKDTHYQIGDLLKQGNYKKVLIHYGSGSIVRSGLLKEITDSLDTAGVSYVTLGGVVPNPRLSKVYEGIRLCREEQVDFILAAGGGSVIDSSKDRCVELFPEEKNSNRLPSYWRDPYHRSIRQ